MKQLREIARVSQERGEPRRRWFRSEDADLFVWQKRAGGIVRFQLTARTRETEVAFAWDAAAGVSIDEVDDGTGGAGHPGSPLLRRSDAVDLELLLAHFEARAAELDPVLRHFVRDRLERGAQGVPANAPQDRSNPLVVFVLFSALLALGMLVFWLQRWGN